MNNDCQRDQILLPGAWEGDLKWESSLCTHDEMKDLRIREITQGHLGGACNTPKCADKGDRRTLQAHAISLPSLPGEVG